MEIGQTAYHREESRLFSLKNITERYDGYGNSIRRVMEQKDKVPGIKGVVADIIQVEKIMRSPLRQRWEEASRILSQTMSRRPRK